MSAVKCTVAYMNYGVWVHAYCNMHSNLQEGIYLLLLVQNTQNIWSLPV